MRLLQYRIERQCESSYIVSFYNQNKILVQRVLIKCSEFHLAFERDVRRLFFCLRDSTRNTEVFSKLPF